MITQLEACQNTHNLKNNYELIAIDFSKQKALDIDPIAI